MTRSINKKIVEIDWDKYTGPESYDPVRLKQALIALNNYDESNAKNGLDNEILFSLGNNHRGTFYPAVLEALDILISIESSGKLESSRKCAYAVLNDLYYFEPEVGSYQNHSENELLSFVKGKLIQYADET